MQLKAFTLLSLALSVIAAPAPVAEPLPAPVSDVEAAAPANPIIAALNDVRDATSSLNQTVANWNGLPLSLLGIVKKNDQLLDKINDGTEIANAAVELTIPEALTLASSTSKLGKEVKEVIDTIIDAKYKFDRYLIVSPIIGSNLKKQKAATTEFSEAIVKKVPAALRPIAEALIKPIYADFDRGIAAYKLF